MAMHNESAPINWRMHGMTARFVGIVAIALGLVIGIYGLEDTRARWLQTALGLLVWSPACWPKAMRSIVP